jgi:peptidyl-prolyl cis-trans isomerase SurA
MMKKFLYLLIFCLNFGNLLAIESKIIYKIQDEIITNIDIKNEYNYLLALNNKLQDLEKEKIFNIAQESIIREKIKKIELIRNSIDVNIDIVYQDELVKNIYLKLNLKSVSDFKKYLETYDLKYENIIKKIKIDALWNELIIIKYDSKVEIDIDDIKNRLKNKKLTTKNYLLSEIVFEIKNKEELESKFLNIKKSIKEVGFENTASIYSISDSGKTGGNIGWINMMSLNKTIQDNIVSLNVGDISSPLIIPGGILILKINDLKEELKIIDFDLELKKLITLERDKQLNQYSKIYFNKTRKNLFFNE